MDRYILFQSHICSENLTWLRDRIDSIFFIHLGCLFIYIITHWTYINLCCICHLITIEVERTSTCGQCVHQATAFTSYSCATTGRGGSKLPCCQPLRRSTLFKEFCNPGGMPPSMEWYQSCSAKFEIEIGNSPWNCTHKSCQRPIGRHHFDMVEAALAFLRSLPEDELSTQWSEDLGFDIGDPAAILTKERFLNSPGIRTRLPAAPVHMFLSGVFFEHGLHLNFIVKWNIRNAFWTLSQSRILCFMHDLVYYDWLRYEQRHGLGYWSRSTIWFGLGRLSS